MKSNSQESYARRIGVIDLNCDLGEGNSPQDCENDRQIMPYISSCNIACGGHAGNDLTIEQSVKNAISNKLNIGAHPGYPDRENFGRTSLSISSGALQDSIICQVNRLQLELSRNNCNLSHIKFHGALYNDIEANRPLAIEMTKFCKQNFPTVSLMGLASGYLQQACIENNLSFISEGFMDRRYLSTGRLTPRSEPGAVISESSRVIDQALSLIQGDKFLTSDGSELRLQVDSICLHSDTKNSLLLSKLLSQKLASNNILVVNYKSI